MIILYLLYTVLSQQWFAVQMHNRQTILLLKTHFNFSLILLHSIRCKIKSLIAAKQAISSTFTTLQWCGTFLYLNVFISDWFYEDTRCGTIHP